MNAVVCGIVVSREQKVKGTGSFGELDSKLPESSHSNIRTSSSQQLATNRPDASHEDTVDMKLYRTTLRHSRLNIVYSPNGTVVTQ